MANTDENKNSAGAFNTSADDLLRSLNAQYKDDTIVKDIAENNEDIDSEQLENAANSAFENAQIDMSSLSDAEFKFLFDSYLAASNFEMNLRDSDYGSLHKHIINLQKKSGVKTLSYDEMKASVYNGCVGNIEEERFQDDEFDGDAPASEGEIEMFRPETGSYDIEPMEELAEEPTAEETVKKEKAPPKKRKSIFAWLKALSHDDDDGEGEEKVHKEPDPIEQTSETTVFDTVVDGDTFGDANDEPLNSEYADEEAAYREEPYDEESFENAVKGAPVYAKDDVVPENKENDEPVLLEEEEESDAEIGGIILPMDDGEDYEEDITPTEEMLENRIEDTSLLDSYEPEISEPKQEEEEPTEESDAMMTDTAMMKAFGIDPRKGTENDIPKYIFDETAYTTLERTLESELPQEDEEPEQEDPNDYVSFDQNKELFTAYKQKYNSVRIRMIVCAVLAAILFAIENIGIFGLSLPAFMQTASGYATVEWALLFVCALLVCDNLVSAAKSLARFEFIPDSVTLLAFVMSIITSAAALFAKGDIKMFNFPFAVCVLFCLAATFISVRKEIFTFKIISSRKNKFAVTLMRGGNNLPETVEFAENLSENSKVYQVVNAEFVDGYLSRKRERPKSYKKLRVLVPVIFVVSVIYGVLSAIVAEAGAYQSVSNAYVSFLMCAPVAIFLACELPMYMSSIRAYSNSSAIIGDAAPEMIEDMSVVAFTDNDVFQGDGVRIKGVKVIENNKIENVIYYASSAFSLVGGPLAKLFKQATLDSVTPENVELRVLSDMGIDAMVDGKHIVIGVPQYMDAQCFQTIYETNDEHWEGKTNKRILYLACDEEIIAKFYIEYNVSPDFVYLVKRLADAGICVSVRSNDPCIDSEIFYKNKLSPEEYPIKVIKGEKEAEKGQRVKARSTVIVSTGSIKGLVKSLLLCNRINKVSNINLIIKSVAALIGAVVMGVLVFTGAFTEMWSVYPAIYQAFCAIPFYLISKFYI